MNARMKTDSISCDVSFCADSTRPLFQPLDKGFPFDDSCGVFDARSSGMIEPMPCDALRNAWPFYAPSDLAPGVRVFPDAG